MNPVARSVRMLGNLATTFQLYEAGHSRRDLAVAVANGMVVRVRQGWYASRDIHSLLRNAATVGGRLTCLTALDLQGAWSYPTSRLHVVVAPNSCRLRAPQDMRRRLSGTVRVHWREDTDSSQFMLPPIASLADVIACQPPDVATAMADSVLRTWPELRADWHTMLRTLPRAQLEWLQYVDGICESGTESLVWCRMRRFMLPMRRQVRIRGVGRVDFLIGERLILEIDSVAYHTDPASFERDRTRDATASRLGYRVLRFSYKQVIYRWPEVERAIMAAVIRGDHHSA